MYVQDFIANERCSNVSLFFVVFSCVWCLHLFITDEIAMALFKCVDSKMCLFHNFVTLIVKRFACFFDCIQHVGSNDVNLKSAANFKLVLKLSLF